MKVRYIECFKTIDLCVDYLISIGCKWDNKRESKLNKDCCYQYKDTLVFYDPYELLINK